MRSISVVQIGATGAVGGYAARTMAQMPEVESITLLGRRKLEEISSAGVEQIIVDVLDPASYRSKLRGHNAAVCTLGVGQPSKMSKEEFLEVDRDSVLAFARECESAGIEHFELLGSVGANPKSRSFYLRAKAELEEGLKALGFRRLSLFRPSMIRTPNNRYGLSQAISLAVWPHLNPLLLGPLRNLRGIEVERLGRAIALNLARGGDGVEVLHWDEIEGVANQ